MEEVNEQQLYAVDRLEQAKRAILLAKEEMPAARKKVEKQLKKDPNGAKDWYQTLRSHQARLLAALEGCRLSLLEMELPDLAAAALGLGRAVANFQLSTPDYSRLCDTLEAFVKGMPDTEDKTASTAIIGRLMNHVRMGFYPTDPDHVKLITRGIDFPDGVTTNLLDPCCGDGIALRLMATGNNCYAYGVELDERRAEEAQTRLHRVAIGSYFSARISHESFHALFLNPPYLSVLGENGQTGRDEKRFLVNGLCHLMQGGLLVYIIPYYRLTADIARILCDNFEWLSVYKFCGKEFQRFRQVAVLGIRKPRGDGSKEVPGLLRQVQDADKIPELTQLPEKSYPLPAHSEKIPIFKGAVFNVPELARQLAASDSFKKLWEQSPLDSKEKRPPLPLTVGQVGLIGGSGLINGLMPCDSPHIIKGRIVKERLTDSRITRVDERTGVPLVTEMTETQTNKMVFHLLTADGFKALA